MFYILTSDEKEYENVKVISLSRLLRHLRGLLFASHCPLNLLQEKYKTVLAASNSPFARANPEMSPGVSGAALLKEVAREGDWMVS